MRRNIWGRDFYLGIMYQLIVAIPKNMLVNLLKFRIGYFYAYLRALGWHLKNAVNQDIHDNPRL